MDTRIIFHHEDWQDAPLPEFVLRFWRQQRRLGAPPSETAAGPVVMAYINQGRWIAECPWGCGAALVASRADARYLCVTCWNEAVGGLWVPVVFPAQKGAIEAELLKRPARDGFMAATRNWQPGESLADLRRENALRGVM